VQISRWRKTTNKLDLKADGTSQRELRLGAATARRKARGGGRGGGQANGTGGEGETGSTKSYGERGNMAGDYSHSCSLPGTLACSRYHCRNDVTVLSAREKRRACTSERAQRSALSLRFRLERSRRTTDLPETSPTRVARDWPTLRLAVGYNELVIRVRFKSERGTAVALTSFSIKFQLFLVVFRCV